MLRLLRFGYGEPEYPLSSGVRILDFRRRRGHCELMDLYDVTNAIKFDSGEIRERKAKRYTQ
jgi:hypothetical protein